MTLIDLTTISIMILATLTVYFSVVILEDFFKGNVILKGFLMSVRMVVFVLFLVMLCVSSGKIKALKIEVCTQHYSGESTAKCLREYPKGNW